MKRRKKIFQWILVSVITITLFAVILEISYRYQWFDFYKAELKGLNRKEDLNSTKDKILVCGDSFSADTSSYVSVLRNVLKNYAIINAAVPGSGIRQHALFIPNRIKRYQPKVFIYQFYVGNDLFDISHPCESSGVSTGRKLYWWLADRWLSLPYLNFRFAGLRYQFYDDAGGNYKPKTEMEFSMDKYSKREKFNYIADPNIIENTLFLKNGREKDWEFFEKNFKKMVSKLDYSCTKILIIIPHQSQVSKEWFDRHHELGSTASEHLYQVETYPLYQKMLKLAEETRSMIVDPLEVFRNSEKDHPNYYANDPHLNQAGNQLLGNYILMKMTYDE